MSYDAPIHSAEDIGATPLAARVVNVKPSRIGSLRALFEVYARCARERRPMYGGGMGELGVGRGQIELLAALFHADAPNDVAPSAYNEDDPPGGLPGQPAGAAPRRRPASAGRRRRGRLHGLLLGRAVVSPNTVLRGESRAEFRAVPRVEVLRWCHAAREPEVASHRVDHVVASVADMVCDENVGDRPPLSGF